MPWTSYAKQRMFGCGLGVLTPPAQLFLALFSTSANPTSSPVELLLGGYARQPYPLLAVDPVTITNSFDVIFGPLSPAGSYLGVGVFGAITAGNLWAWDDEGAPITIPDSTNVVFAAGVQDWVLV